MSLIFARRVQSRLVKVEGELAKNNLVNLFSL